MTLLDSFYRHYSCVQATYIYLPISFFFEMVLLVPLLGGFIGVIGGAVAFIP